MGNLSSDRRLLYGRIALVLIFLLLYPILSGFCAPANEARVATCDNFSRCEAEQTKPTWCWAACTQMVYRYHQQTITQQEVVTNIVGTNADQSAGYYEIVKALSDRQKPPTRRSPLGSVTDTLNYPWLQSTVEKFKPKKENLVEQLTHHEPCIVGLVEDPALGIGHACVVFEIEFEQKENLFSKFLKLNKPASSDQTDLTAVIPMKNVTLRRVKIFDPWPGKGETNMTGLEFEKQLQFVLSLNEAKQVYQAFAKNVANSQTGNTGKVINVDAPKITIPSVQIGSKNSSSKSKSLFQFNENK